MNPAAMKLGAVTLGATFAGVLSKSSEAVMRSYNTAFTKDEIAVKVVAAFIISLALLIYGVLAFPLGWWMLTIVPVGTLVGAVVLTTVHFAGSVMIDGAKSVTSIVRAFFSGATANV